MVGQNKAEFSSLFQEFLNSYPYTPSGLRHIAAYDQQRQQGRRNFEAISAAVHLGEDVTEAILVQLLPYKDTVNNRQKIAWIHIASVVTKDIKELFEIANLNQPEDWRQVAEAVLSFITCCNDNPKQLSTASKKFSELPYSQIFPAEILTPIINALRPEEFLLITDSSRLAINYFANTAYTQKLTDYPKLNFYGHKLIAELSDIMHQSGVPALRDEDLFDMFSHWLLAVKKYDFIHQNTAPSDERIELFFPLKQMPLNPKYSLKECADDTGFDESEIERWIRAIQRKQQAIFYGSPGTGKTFIAERVAKHLIGGGEGFYELVQFHPAYTYEDFIQGIRPQSQDGKLTYPLVPGRFLEFCKKAESFQDTCVLIIDEINRANLAQVLGELMYLLEYREQAIPLAGGNLFRIPKNVRIIGTMNTADRSISQIDHALRRRFAFIELVPNYDVLRRYHLKTGFAVEGLIKILQNLNHAIADKNYEIGISFFLSDNLREDIEDIWQMEIEPYLEEYFFNQLDKVDEFRWDKIKRQLRI